MARESIGQTTYEAYCEHTDWKSLVTGKELPDWDDVRPEIKEAWEAAGRAAAEISGGVVHDP